MSSRSALGGLLGRLPLYLVIAIVVALAVNAVRWAIVDWNLNDVDVYWDAATRLRGGGSPYGGSIPIDLADPDGLYRQYRYAPWFAALWVPLTLLPRPVVEMAWSIVLVGVSAWIVSVPARHGLPGAIPALLLGTFLLGISSGGNVQPLLVGALLFGVDRRSGPIWVALAASLKVVPVLFVLLYLARREWTRAAVALGLSAVLLAPALLFEIPSETFASGPAQTWSGLAHLAVAGAASLIAYVIALRSPVNGPLAIATASILALPRLLPYESTLLAAGLSPLLRRRD